MGSRDSRRIDFPDSTSKWLPIVLLAAGWSVAWAIGLIAVENVSPLTGWVVLGAIGGLVTARVLHFAHPSFGVKRLLVVVAGWVGAGLCASVATYDVITGWISMGVVGGGLTSVAVARKKGFQMFIQIFMAAISWATAGIIGARIAMTGGRQIGAYIGTAIGGREAPFIVSGIAWAVGGCITGALGGAVMSWRFLTAENSAEM